MVAAGSSEGGKALAAMSVGQGREAAFRSFLEQWIGGHPGARHTGSRTWTHASLVKTQIPGPLSLRS